MRLKDKIAIVAGSGQVIGAEIVRCLADEGADMAVIFVLIAPCRSRKATSPQQCLPSPVL